MQEVSGTRSALRVSSVSQESPLDVSWSSRGSEVEGAHSCQSHQAESKHDQAPPRPEGLGRGRPETAD